MEDKEMKENRAKIIQLIPATDWQAVFCNQATGDGHPDYIVWREPLLAWALLSDGEVIGQVVPDGRFPENASEVAPECFIRYEHVRLDPCTDEEAIEEAKRRDARREAWWKERYGKKEASAV